MSDEWYYVNSQQSQAGPVTLDELKKLFQQKEFTLESLCWTNGMDNWTAVGEVSTLAAALKPPAMAPPAVPGTAPPKFGGDLASALAARANRGAASPTAGSAAPTASASAASSPSSTSSTFSSTSSTAASSPTFGTASRAAATTASSPTFGTAKSKADEPKKPTKALPQTSSSSSSSSTSSSASSSDANAHGWVELFTQDKVPYFYNKFSKVTSWDKPDCLKSAEEMDKAGEWVWMPHEDWAFVPARKLPQAYSDGKHHLETEDGTHHALPAKVQLETLTWSSLRRPVQDLVMLDEMSLPLILHALKTRFQNNEIYTNVGTILISINPYKRLPLYTPTVIEQYQHHGTKVMPPHVYMIADAAYNNLIENGRAQSIVISGESGAGKTECTKQALQYLAEIAGSSTSNVEQRILAANPILEAFGNAKTVRNNNSSRFGKYVVIYFDSRLQISGATNTNYLLEKIRVVHQSAGERNYHAFYQLCRGAPAALRTQLRVGAVSDYWYLSQSGCDTVDDVDDARDYEEVVSSMRELGWSEEEIQRVYVITAAVLHLGNIKFRPDGDRKCAVVDKSALDTTVALLQVDPTAFHKAVTTRVMRIAGQADIDVPLGKEEAEQARDALAKFVYEKLFDWIVQRINQAIGKGSAGSPSVSSSSSSSSSSAAATVGVLDIFGFEIFESNLFEQLCINYTNEKLQQFFNQHTFRKEEEVYQFEGINFAHVHYIDNQPVLDLIDSKPDGILHSVNEEIRMPKGTDKTFVDKLIAKQSKHSHFRAYLKNPNMFVVEHYAGTVVYDSNGFLEKNRDQLTEDAYDVLQKSKFGFLAGLFADSTSATKKVTLGTKFASQLTDLMAALNQTEPHYIRCVKPNPNKAAMEFHPMLVLEQLRYSGVFEAVKIRKSGFPFRYSHIDFVKRFKCILPRHKWGPDAKANCRTLIAQLQQTEDKVQVGRSRVLYRAAEHRAMELARNLAVEAVSIKIQARVRGWLARRLKKRLLAARPKLRAALQSRDLAVIDKTLAELPHLGFEILELAQVKRLRFVLQEEKRVEQVLVGLLQQDPERVYEELSKAVAAADDIELRTDLAERARAAVAGVKDRKQARAWLQEGVAEADEQKLKWAVDTVRRLKMPDSTAAAEVMLTHIAKEKTLVAALESALASGGFVREGDVINAAALRPAVNAAQAHGCRTPAGAAVFARAELVCRVRETLKAAQGTKDKALWKAVEEVVRRAAAAGEGLDRDPEVVKACEEVSHQAAVDEVTENLERAVRELNQEELTYNLAQAQNLRVDEKRYPVVPVAREYLARIVEARAQMEAAMAAVDEEKLLQATYYAESFNYETAQVQQCRVLRDTVMQLNLDASYALEMLEEEHMRDVLARAAQVRLVTKDITQLKTLLFHTAEDKFVQLQMKAAVKLSDTSRRIRLTIKLKDMFFKKSGPMFVLDNCMRLRRPGDWADMKLLTLSREKLAAGMRRHTLDTIHAALTETEEDDKKESLARNMFKNLLGFMGDRSYSSPVTLAHEVLVNCLQVPWLRDETYCQLIKQLTGNPSSESSRKGWQFMCCCLETFPPQADFENYLEMWLRTNASPPEKYVRLLHTVVYGGARAAAPSELEINKVCSGSSLRHIDFDTKVEYKPPRARIPAHGEAPASSSSPSSSSSSSSSSTSFGRGAPPSLPGAAKAPLSKFGTAPGFTAPPLPEEEEPVPPPPPQRHAAPKPPEPKVSKWAVAYDANQTPYYYNTETNEVTWEKPAELLE